MAGDFGSTFYCPDHELWCPASCKKKRDHLLPMTRQQERAIRWPGVDKASTFTPTPSFEKKAGHLRIRCNRCDYIFEQPEDWAPRCPMCYAKQYKEGGDITMYLDRLKTYDMNRASEEEMICLSLFAKQVVAEYQANNLPVPEWITEKADSIRRDINTKRRDSLIAAKKELTARKEALKTQQEKSRDINKRMADIDAQLEGLK